MKQTDLDNLTPEQEDQLILAADLINRFGGKTLKEAQERQRLFLQEKKNMKQAGEDYAFQSKTRSNAAIRANRWYKKKRAAQDKPYIPMSIRILGKKKARELGYKKWSEHEDPIDTSGEPHWMQGLTSEERLRLDVKRQGLAPLAQVLVTTILKQLKEKQDATSL